MFLRVSFYINFFLPSLKWAFFLWDKNYVTALTVILLKLSLLKKIVLPSTAITQSCAEPLKTTKTHNKQQSAGRIHNRAPSIATIVYSPSPNHQKRRSTIVNIHYSCTVVQRQVRHRFFHRFVVRLYVMKFVLNELIHCDEFWID